MEVGSIRLTEALKAINRILADIEVVARPGTTDEIQGEAATNLMDAITVLEDTFWALKDSK